MEKYFPQIELHKRVISQNLETYLTGSTKKILQADFHATDVPGIVLVCKSQFLAKEVANRHVCTICDSEGVQVQEGYKNHHSCKAKTKKGTVRGKTIETDVIHHNKKFVVQYQQHNNHIEIDLALFNCSSNDKTVVFPFLKELLSRRSLLGARHNIIVYGIDALSNNSLVSMRQIIESSHDNAYFVFTCEKLSPSIQSSIATRCFYINVSRDFDIVGMTKLLLSNRNDMSESCHETLIRMSKNDILNICILLDVSPKLMNEGVGFFTGHLYMMIENMLMTSIKLTREAYSLEKEMNPPKSPNENLITCGDLLRQACTEIGAACASLVQVAECVIKFTAIYYPHVVHDIVQYSAAMEHTAFISNKELFILELYFHQVVTTIMNF